MPKRPKRAPGLRSHFNQAVARRPSGGGREAGQPAQVPPPLPAQVPSPSGSRSVNSCDRPEPGGACALLPALLGVTHAPALGLSLRPAPLRTALAPSPRLRPHGASPTPRPPPRQHCRTGSSVQTHLPCSRDDGPARTRPMGGM